MQRNQYSWVVKKETPQRQYSGRNTCTPIGHHTDRDPMGLGQYNSLGRYCDPHTASSVSYINILLQRPLPQANLTSDFFSNYESKIDGEVITFRDRIIRSPSWLGNVYSVFTRWQVKRSSPFLYWVLLYGTCVCHSCCKGRCGRYTLYIRPCWPCLPRRVVTSAIRRPDSAYTVNTL